MQFRSIHSVMYLFVLALVACSGKSVQKDPLPGTHIPENAVMRNDTNSAIPAQLQRECHDQAMKALGANAQVLRCGDINTPGIPEVVAVLLAKFPKAGSGVAISKMAILRKWPTGWRKVLMVARQIQNDAGYVGLDYIDDYFHFYGYWLVISDSRSDHVKAFDVDLVDIENANGTSEAADTEIAWNPAVERYQEFHPDGFQPEIKDPPHWKPGVKLPSPR